MNLLDIFSAVAYKELAAVEIPHLISHEHELNGVAALQNLFGTAGPTRGRISWHYFSDEADPSGEENEFTFYDARAKSFERTGRSEWRFYYVGNFLERASAGDLCVLAYARSGELFGLVFQKDSGYLRAAKVLFGIKEAGKQFASVSDDDLGKQNLEFFRQQILDELGLDVSYPVAPTDEELIAAAFGDIFPPTKIMSEFARSQTDCDITNPDHTLVRWLEREEQLFRAMEKTIIEARLAKGFDGVDDFISYSLSVQNRRKSRMGHSLQNHLEELFTNHGLRFTSQARTEHDRRPDFIFPGEKEYRDAKFRADLLVMLGVKSSSKDRWRQVLVEADRIPAKHLCTLEPGISERQTDEMSRKDLTLVIPASLHATYLPKQQKILLSVSEFVDFVRARQS